jgi:hypothetical protein
VAPQDGLPRGPRDGWPGRASRRIGLAAVRASLSVDSQAATVQGRGSASTIHPEVSGSRGAPGTSRSRRSYPRAIRTGPLSAPGGIPEDPARRSQRAGTSAPPARYRLVRLRGASPRAGSHPPHFPGVGHVIWSSAIPIVRWPPRTGRRERLDLRWIRFPRRGFPPRFAPPSPFPTTLTVYPSPDFTTSFSRSRSWGSSCRRMDRGGLFHGPPSPEALRAARFPLPTDTPSRPP